MAFYFPTMSIPVFAQKCRDLYDREQEGSPAHCLLVYAVLFSLCAEFSILDDSLEAKHYNDLGCIFQQWTLRTVARFPLIAPASQETIEALTAAVCLDGIIVNSVTVY